MEVAMTLEGRPHTRTPVTPICAVHLDARLAHNNNCFPELAPHRKERSWKPTNHPWIPYSTLHCN